MWCEHAVASVTCATSGTASSVKSYRTAIPRSADIRSTVHSGYCSVNTRCVKTCARSAQSTQLSCPKCTHTCHDDDAIVKAAWRRRVSMDTVAGYWSEHFTVMSPVTFNSCQRHDTFGLHTLALHALIHILHSPVQEPLYTLTWKHQSLLRTTAGVSLRPIYSFTVFSLFIVPSLCAFISERDCTLQSCNKCCTQSNH
jgi:hypothetical protein